MRCLHRHLREIDCSSALVGGPAAGAVSGGQINTLVPHVAPKVAAAADITTTVNKGRQAGPMSSLLL